jgi:hypothetical protein
MEILDYINGEWIKPSRWSISVWRRQRASSLSADGKSRSSAICVGSDAVEFFIQKNVVVERWSKDWSRRF